MRISDWSSDVCSSDLLATGKMLSQTKLPSNQFGEGITRWGDQIIGVTWRGGVGNRWSIKDMKPVGTFNYEGEGWGVTMVGDSLVLSDGTPALRDRKSVV